MPRIRRTLITSSSRFGKLRGNASNFFCGGKWGGFALRGGVGLLQQRVLFPRCAAQGGGGCAAGRGALAGCSGGCFQRFTPRGVWRLRGGAKFRWRVAAGGAFSVLRRAGYWRLRGGAKFRWRVAAGGAFSVLRRAGYCVGAGPAERCGRFSCFAHAPLIKKSGQKRNHGFLWPALPSSRSVWGTRASAALRAVSVGDRGRKGSFGCVGKILGVGFTLRSEVPCCVAPKGGPVFRDRNGRCGLLQSSHLGGFAARCALRAALRRARGRPRSPNAGCTSTTFPPRLREPRPFFWAAFLSLRRLRCGKKSRGPGLLTAAFVQLEAASLEKIRVPGFFSGYFSLPAAIRRERKVPAAPRGSRDNAANRAA